MNSANTKSDWRKQHLIRFLSVGALNMLVGYGIYAVLVYIDLPYLLALFMATITGIVFNYFSYGRMVFKERGGWFIFRKFVVAYAVVYTINAALLGALTEGAYLNAYVAQGICILPSVVMNWLLMNYWVYRNRL
jgi:putative flippase GtrA